LVGGSGPHEGYVYALNPVTKIYGPVCDDLFTANAVSLKIFLFDCSLIMFYKIQLNEYSIRKDNECYFMIRPMLFASS